MIQLRPHHRIFRARAAVDFRKGIDGLVTIVRDVFSRDPFSGHLFVFHNKRRTSLKILVYDGYGFWLMIRRLSQGRYRRYVFSSDDALISLAAHELHVLLVNGDARRLKVPGPWRPLS